MNSQQRDQNHRTAAPPLPLAGPRNAGRRGRAAILLGVLLPALAVAADYHLADLAKAGKIELFNRKLDSGQSGSPGVVSLDEAANDGLAWISGVNFSNGTIEVEIRGRDLQGQSFVGIAFHGQDNRTFDGVYLRPFNFQAADAQRRNHSIQYISMPDHDWSELRNKFPGKYEAALTPAPAPDSWVTLKLVVQGKNVSAFVNHSEKPALTAVLLNGRLQGKVGLWVGNGSNGSFRNLKVTAQGK